MDAKISSYALRMIIYILRNVSNKEKLIMKKMSQYSSYLTLKNYLTQKYFILVWKWNGKMTQILSLIIMFQCHLTLVSICYMHDIISCWDSGRKQMMTNNNKQDQNITSRHFCSEVTVAGEKRNKDNFGFTICLFNHVNTCTRCHIRIVFAIKVKVNKLKCHYLNVKTCISMLIIDFW